MSAVYFVFAHPQRQRSRANATILERIDGLPNVTVCDLYECYPSFHIDVEREQQRLLEHQVVVLQQPFYWYGMPPLLKLWVDEVFESGWAYAGGTALKGKTLQLSLTAGGPDSAYTTEGYNRYSIEELTKPYEQIAFLCGMSWPKPLVLHNSNKASREQIEAHAELVRDRLLTHTNKLYQPGVSP